MLHQIVSSLSTLKVEQSPLLLFPLLYYPIKMLIGCTNNAASRAILKLVYWFGVPNSNPQTLKSVEISGVSFHHCSLLQNHKSDVFSYSESKIVKVFQGFAPGPHWGGLTGPPRLPSCTTVFLLVMLFEKPAGPQNC